MAGVLLVYARPTLSSYFFGFVPVILGEGVRVWAAGHLRKNEVLTTSGPYAYLKNPLYFGTFWIMTGFCLMARNLPLMGVGLTAFLLYYAPYKKHREGSRLLERFGESWREYDRRVPDYLPRLTPYKGRGNQKWDRSLFLKNDEQGTLLSVLLGLTLVALRLWM
jgi:protein-S-isoprenylcysteine O-methyltransferase Ste14